MAVHRIDPPALATPVRNLYSQVTVSAPGDRLVAIAGQVALDTDGALVGAGDVAAQAEQAFRNLRAALEAAGGTPADLLKYTIHVVGSTPDLIEPVFDALRRAFGEVPLAASTWVGVAALALPEWLVEVDGLAAIGSRPHRTTERTTP
ncbi:RidA family protein [Umezawaea tangerina]|uniref:Enamine deaminase RidA (YjgF/YER057c/UK114 family) n=1 Tax=Umezawaea tangerina TaxID=84725 RepID=A0A2T0T1S0_9PSEU|nr:RidA family protein [Umezawaea tangerina]PRY39606.1 enamine deaminase RidA (YjgF/YER057c/UK114 family) [Umezawaea tangerina]